MASPHPACLRPCEGSNAGHLFCTICRFFLHPAALFILIYISPRYA
ncbi:hypothetical protein ENTCAN_06976 [Enterobacter cancerogenus ATCC 35316]|nr:hypothetical protein ENTCAN_06976 [Enterobacter cancerogenus ATCC 35316]